ncbi:YdcH family protein [Ideonella sp. B7]|uniref:YdcH family protein n=1 Tax=Ideonella benzenivorans TaxID=2831643 RepID=UPI001CEC07C3|nr:YdcH family protein [Ideonella benzenivorans]MCA6217585.1 YdcH family protein [Ideonella benzenivorans]
MVHAELDSRIDGAGPLDGPDELTLRRLKKQRLALRDQIAQLEAMLEPPEPA